MACKTGSAQPNPTNRDIRILKRYIARKVFDVDVQGSQATSFARTNSLCRVNAGVLMHGKGHLPSM